MDSCITTPWLHGWATLPNSFRVLLLISLGCGSFAAAEERLQFNRDIRPILADKCFYCHGQDGNKRQGDLRLDDREAALKAKAFVPGDSKASTLIARINSTDADIQMP